MSENCSQSFTVAVVGDVHDHWSPADQQALLALEVDLVLFVGDYGNESLTTVRQVAQLPLPKAIVFGNHDAWYTATPWGRKRCPYDRDAEDWFQQQWDLLQPFHVGYRAVDFHQLKISVVGGRPFSWGGPKWFASEFYQTWFGVSSFEESRDRIIAALRSAAYEQVIVVSHNGPFGLGAEPEDMCGKDWRPIGGDQGDRDLTEAIAAVPEKRVSLVTFGHMHHRLSHRRDRIRERFCQDAEGRMYLNAAAVPRVQTGPAGSQHQFSLVTFQAQTIRDVISVWVSETGTILSMEPLFTNSMRPQVPSAT